MVSDQLLIPTPINANIARNNRTSVVIKATNKSLQASKTALTPSLSQIIEHKTRENNRLNELVYFQRKKAIGLSTLKTAKQLVAELHHILKKYKKLKAVIDYNFGKDGWDKKV